jgi:hypothetical protein
MKSVTIKIGDYDVKTIEDIFEKEPDFKAKDPRDDLIVEILRQIKDNPKIDLGEDETTKSE